MVQIDFDIEENPLSDLINDINEMKAQLIGAVDKGEDGIDDLIKTAKEASDIMDELAKSAKEAGNTNVDGLTNSVGETTAESKKMQASLTSLIKQAVSLSKVKLTAAFDRMKAIPRTVFNKITGGLHKMKNGFGQIKSMSFRQLMSSLNQLAGKGLAKGWQGAKKLGIALKEAAKVSLNKLSGQITALIPKMKQLGSATVKALGNGLAKGVQGAGKAFAGMAKKAVNATKTMNIALLGASTAAFKVGMDFDSSMSQVAATMGMSVEGIHDKTSQQYKDFEMLNKEAREQGKNTKYSAAEAGDALNYLALAGYDADKAVGALPTVLTLATAGGMELAETSDMVTDSMSALGIEATQSNLENFGNQLAKTAQKSNTSVQQLGAAILTVGGTAKNLFGDTKEMQTAEMNTALGILADSGIKGSEGGTKLRNIIQSLTPTTKPAIQAFEELGVSAYDAQGNMRPMEDTFKDITSAMDGMSTEKQTQMLSHMFNKTDLKAVSAFMAATATNTEQLATSFAAAEIPVEKLGINLDDLIKGFDATQDQAAFVKQTMKEFGVDAEQAGTMYAGLMSVVGKDGDNRWQDLKNKVIDSDKAMQNMADTMNDNLKGRLTELSSATQEVGIAFTRNLMEPAKDTVKEITGWMADLGTSIDEGGFNGLVKGLGTFSTRVIGLLAKAAPQGMKAGMKIMSSLLSGLEANRGNIAQAGVEVLTAFVLGMSDMIPRLFILGVEILGEFLTGVSKKLPKMMQKGQEGIQKLLNGIMKEVPVIIQAGTKIIISLLQGLTQNLPSVVQAGIGIVMMLLQSLVSMTPYIIQGAVVLINSLVSGIQQNLPQIVNSAFYIILSLIQGIADCAPQLIDTAIDLIFYIGEGILQNLPQIAEAGFKIILALLKGIAKASVMLGKFVFKAITGLIDMIKNVNWLDVGKKIIGSIKDGIVNGAKSLFNGGKEAAQEAESGFNTGTEGFDFSLPTDTGNSFNWGQTQGQQTVQGFNAGLSNTGLESLTFENIGLQQTEGLTNDFNTLSNASSNMETSVTGSIQNVNTSLGELASNTTFTDLSNEVQTGMTGANTATAQGMNQMKSVMTKGLDYIVRQFTSKMNAVKNIAASTNLYYTGQNIVNGLINGMKSKEGQLLETAKKMAETIKNSTNEALDIHSPSREMKKTGINIVLGTKVGMEQTFGDLKKTSNSMGKTIKKETDKQVSPQARYAPGNTVATNTRQSSQTIVYHNNYKFEVTGSVDRQSEFRIKKIIREMQKEEKEQRKRLHPRTREA